MTVKLCWDKSRNAAIGVFAGAVTAQDIQQSIISFMPCLSAASHSVNLIVDWRRVKTPPLLADFLHLTLTILRHENLGHVAIMGTSSEIMYWTSILTIFVPFPHSVHRSMEDATCYLRELNQPALEQNIIGIEMVRT